VPARLLDGRALAEEIRGHLRTRLSALAPLRPGLLLIRVGDDPASEVYVRGKERAAADLGIDSRTLVLPAETPEADLLARVGEANADPAVHGLLVQLPVPPQIRPEAVAEAIDPRKDADGLHPLNLGRLALGRPEIVPCTPLGVLCLLLRYGIEPAGRRIVVVGRSAIVGRPLSLLLSLRAPWSDATVTLAHSRTADLGSLLRGAEVVIAALGKPASVTREMIRPGAVVVDVGMHRLADPSRPGKTLLVGDVDRAGVEPVAGWLSPVPGGVGPLTVAMLLANTVQAAERALGRPTVPMWEEVARWPALPGMPAE
jgi:methylenetetrahydrofolate dehydrogenase (NADP+) / methenyltetrahydrofolate cyclohydrolase